MAERVVSTRTRNVGRGGARQGAGRKRGGMNIVTKHAQKKARAMGKLPAELLHTWALGGTMMHNGKAVVLDIAQRIDCAKSCARFYSATLQPKPAEDAKPTVHRILLDVDQLSTQPVARLKQLRELLVGIQKGVIDPSMLDDEDGMPYVDDGDIDDTTHPDRYAALLNADTKTDGNA